MRQWSGLHYEERIVFILIDKLHQCIEYKIIGIVFLLETRVVGFIVWIFILSQNAFVRIHHFVLQIDTFVIVIEKCRIIGMCLSLAIVSIKLVKSLFPRRSF